MAHFVKQAVYSDIDIELRKQADGDITRDLEEDAIINSLINIINTMQGSRRMLPEFAIDIHKLLFEPIDDVTARYIGERVLQAIEYWDERVEVVGLEIEPRYDQNEYRCRMNFKIRAANVIETIDFILK